MSSSWKLFRGTSGAKCGVYGRLFSIKSCSCYSNARTDKQSIICGVNFF